MADVAESMVQNANPRLRERLILAIGQELRAIEGTIANEIDDCPLPLVSETGKIISRQGGLRLRATLLLLAARLAGYRGPLAARMGHIVELLHVATLIHDRLASRAPAANDDAAVLVGDYLYARSLYLVVRDGDARILNILASSLGSVTEAQVFEVERRRSGRLGEADYLRIIAQRTGAFMSACCRIGGVLGQSDPDQLEALTRYGLDVGIALQINNDFLDDALELAGGYARSAKDALRPFADCADKETLTLIADFVVGREP